MHVQAHFQSDANPRGQARNLALAELGMTTEAVEKGNWFHSYGGSGSHGGSSTINMVVSSH